MSDWIRASVIESRNVRLEPLRVAQVDGRGKVPAIESGAVRP